MWLRILAVEKQRHSDYELLLHIRAEFEPSQHFSALTNEVKRAANVQKPQFSDGVALSIYGLDPPLNYNEIRLTARAREAVRKLDIGSSSFEKRSYLISVSNPLEEFESVTDDKVAVLVVVSPTPRYLPKALRDPEALHDPAPWEFDAYERFWVNRQDPVVESDEIRRLAINCGDYPIYVRQEYITLWDLVRGNFEKLIAAERTHKGGVIILGQPGIGKSLFLKFALLQALKAHIPTVFCEQPQTFTFFDEAGVRTRSAERFQSSEKILALCDSNLEQEPPIVFHRSQAYIVHATSPSSRYRGWAKRREPSVVIMNGWEHQEANDLFKLCNIRQPDGYYQPMELFEYFAPVVRECFISCEKTTNGVPEDKGLVNATILFDISELVTFLHSATVYGDKRPEYFYRYLCASRRPGAQLKLHPYNLAIPSLFDYRISNPSLVPLIVKEFAKRDLQQQEKFLRAVSSYPAIVDTVFGSFAANWLAKSNVSSLTCTLLNGEKLEIPLDLPRRNLSNLSEGNIEDNVIYVPPQRTFSTLDAVVVSQKRVISLQMTGTKYTHEPEGGGIRKVRNWFGHQATSYAWYFIFFVRIEEDGKRLADSVRSSENMQVPVPGDRSPLQVGYAVLKDIEPFKSLQILDSLPKSMIIEEGLVNTIREEFDQAVLDVKMMDQS